MLNNKSLNTTGPVLKQEDPQKRIHDLITKISGIFKEVVINLKIVLEGFSLKVFNENSKEITSIKYAPQEIFAEIDLSFKEVVTIKAMGFEIQSKESLSSLEKSMVKIMEDLKNIKDFLDKELTDVPSRV